MHPLSSTLSFNSTSSLDEPLPSDYPLSLHPVICINLRSYTLASYFPISSSYSFLGSAFGVHFRRETRKATTVHHSTTPGFLATICVDSIYCTRTIPSVPIFARCLDSIS